FELSCGFPAHVAENIPRTGRLDNRDVRAIDQLLERRGRFGVSRVRKDAVVDADAVTVRPAGAVVELDRLVLVTRDGAGWLGRLVRHFEPVPHGELPVLAPADLEQRLESLFDAVGSDEGD